MTLFSGPCLVRAKSIEEGLAEIVQKLAIFLRRLYSNNQHIDFMHFTLKLQVLNYRIFKFA